jgi:hypothetical protein
VGMFFVQSLSRFGTGWAVNVDRVDYAGIQMNFDFRRINNWSGFINTNLYFIDFSANGAITPYAVQ